eukprot:TRINITY_DN48547_c0_g1_i1.p1 TRINITY_DN48547_c0_g1~~TRINITY_DN48547_c0_g1_i1.p1  ORF type:complete len:496 (+),score=76.60 TRINITY_DN48547_c0_g1_i1:56-1543(+)
MVAAAEEVEAVRPRAFNTSTPRPTHEQGFSRAPGPGFYESEQMDGPGLTSLCDPSFRSRSDRLESLRVRNPQFPGPGSYLQSQSRYRAASAKGPSSAWAAKPHQRSRSQRGSHNAMWGQSGVKVDLAVHADGMKETEGGCRQPASARAASPRSSKKANRQRCKSMFAADPNAPVHTNEKVFFWIGTEACGAPVRRQKRLGKAAIPMSAFNSGTIRQSQVEKEAEGKPGPGEYEDPLGFADEAIVRARGSPYGESQGAFLSSSKRRFQLRLEDRPRPETGPGCYEDEDFEDGWKSSRPMSPVAFGASAKRFSGSAATSSPGPAAAHASWVAQEAGAPSPTPTPPPVGFGSSQSRCLTASPAERETPPMLLSDPKRLLDASARRTFRRYFEGEKDTSTPAPDHYRPQSQQSRHLFRNQPPEEGFLLTTPRFTERPASVLGPGKYNPELQDPEPQAHDFTQAERFKFSYPRPEVQEEDDSPDLALFGISRQTPQRLKT